MHLTHHDRDNLYRGQGNCVKRGGPVLTNQLMLDWAIFHAEIGRMPKPSVNVVGGIAMCMVSWPPSERRSTRPFHWLILERPPGQCSNMSRE